MLPLAIWRERKQVYLTRALLSTRTSDNGTSPTVMVDDTYKYMHTWYAIKMYDMTDQISYLCYVRCISRNGTITPRSHEILAASATRCTRIHC